MFSVSLPISANKTILAVVGTELSATPNGADVKVVVDCVVWVDASEGY